MAVAVAVAYGGGSSPHHFLTQLVLICLRFISCCRDIEDHTGRLQRNEDKWH